MKNMRSIIASAILLVAAAPAWAAAIPVAFQGDWAPNLAECRDIDHISVMTIGPNYISFYEAETIEGTLRILRSTKTELVLTNRMRGEGRRFKVTLNLRLSANRKTMTWSGFGRDPKEARLDVRCPK